MYIDAGVITLELAGQAPADGWRPTRLNLIYSTARSLLLIKEEVAPRQYFSDVRSGFSG